MALAVFAYLDPGTGSYLLQLGLASVLGVSYAVKHYWSRLKGIFTRGDRAATDKRDG